MSKDKSKSKTPTTTTSKPVAPAASAAPASAPATPAEPPKGKKERKPGPYADKAVGSTVPYTLSNGVQIQAVVTKDGHCACPTCSKQLATTIVNDAQKVERVKEREQERISGAAAEFRRIGEIIAKERARTGLPALSPEELLKEIATEMLKPAAPEAEAKAS